MASAWWRRAAVILSVVFTACEAEVVVPVGGEIERISIEPASVVLSPGGTVQLDAVVTGGDGTPLSNSDIRWASENSQLVEVSASGVVLAKMVGTTRVAASARGVDAIATITVAPPSVATVTVDPTAISLIIGENRQVTATAHDAKGTVVTDRSVDWLSQNPSVVRVDAAGVITAVSIGSTIVTATIDGISADVAVEVTKRPVATVTVNPATASTFVGATVQLTAVARAADGTILDDRPVSWSTSDEDVASVTSSGLVTGIAVGSATITAQVEGVTATATIQISNIPVAHIELYPTSLSLRVDSTFQVLATAFDANGDPIPGRTVSWQSADPTIASVSSDGVVSGVRPGNTVVTATAGGVSAGVAVEVSALPVDRVEVTPASVSLLVGNQQAVTARPRAVSGLLLGDREVRWTISDENIATLSAETGRTITIEALAEGTATLTATSEGKSTDVAVTISNVPVSSVAVVPASHTMIQGESFEFLAQTLSVTGTDLGRPVDWESDNLRVATIDESGLVTARDSGTAVISATSEGVTGTATVTVTLIPVASVVIEPANPTVELNSSIQLKAVAKDAQDNNLDGRAVVWSSAAPAIVSIDPNPDGTAMATGLQRGSPTTVFAIVEGKQASTVITVTEAAVASIEISPPNVTIAENGSANVSATPRDASGNSMSGRVITWSSTDPSVAQVDPVGTGAVAQVLGLRGGSTTIVASSEGISVSAEVTVTPVPVASVEVTPSHADLFVGATTEFTAIPRDGGGSPLAGRTIEWKSSAESVATVDPAGRVTAVGPGTATIQATAQGVTGSATVNVAQVPVATVEIAPSAGAVSVGGTLQLEVILRDANGNDLDRPVAWTSDDNGIATVSPDGLVTAVAPGTTMIRATSEGVTATASIEVTAVPVATVEVTPASETLDVGATVQLTATLRDANNNILDRPVAWTSDDNGIATVSPTGLVAAVAMGTTMIRATSEGVTATASIEVAAPPVATIDVTPASETLDVGATVQLTATLRDANNNILDRPVAWTSDDNGIATVSPTGLVTAVAPGTTMIRATSEGVTATASIEVAAAPVATIEVTPASETLDVGATVQLTATLRDANDNVLVRHVAWTSDDNGIATVSPTGLVTAVAPGTTTIRATSEDVEGTAEVTITSEP